jgi:hypothetical protein
MLRGLRVCSESVYCLTLRVGMNRVLEVGRPLHPLMPENWVAQGGFAVLLCALVATEWAEELLWRIARVRWSVIDSMQRHPSGMVPVPS